MASQVLISRLRKVYPEHRDLTDEQLLVRTKDTLVCAGININIAKEQLVKAMANHLPVFDKQFGKIRIRRNVK